MIKKVIAVSLTSLAALTTLTFAQAQSADKWPERAVTIVVPAAAGGDTCCGRWVKYPSGASCCG